MYKKIILFCGVALPHLLFSQVNFSGTVKSEKTKEELSYATVSLRGTSEKNITNAFGKFSFKGLLPGKYALEITLLGFEILTQEIVLDKDTDLDFYLNENIGCILPTVQISATQADSKSGVVFTKLNSEQLNTQNLGQDLPYLLNQTPGVVVTSDAGSGIGYTGIRIRGTDGTRINVTINGVPVNDAESQGTYWVDLPDVISSVDNIQIQRGVGTSTNGAGAFGGSINIETIKLKPLPYAQYNVSSGSFNTLKNTLQFGTGLIDNKFSFDGRFSKIKSEGYVDRSYSDLKSYYFSGGYYGKKSSIKFITFSGLEETYQSWYGVHKDSLKTNRTFNMAGLYFDSLGNIKFYENQIDHYKQEYYQLHYSYQLNSDWNFKMALHYTQGAGYYEEYRPADNFSSYGLPNIIIGTDTLTNTDLIRRKWLDNDFYGTTFSLNYLGNKKLSAILGGAYNIYDGDHFGKIIWAQYASTSTIDKNYYFDNALKKDFNLFAKANYQLIDKLNIFADIQLRTVDYTFLGYDDALNNVMQQDKLIFINPKLGVNFMINENSNVYGFYGVGNKEPNRDDYTQSTPKSRPKHETLNDFELGYNYSQNNIAFGLNTYYMMYKNQLVLTGAINDVGAYNRSNVESSYRAGIEALLTIKFLKYFEWNANVVFSKNTIERFVEFTDNYDLGTQDSIVYDKTSIAFSPATIASSNFTYEYKGIKCSFITKYVGEQFLDNTSSADRIIKSYMVNDLLLSYTISPKFMREVELKILINNMFNYHYESNGYTYGYVYGGSKIQESYYYPQAGINFLAGLSIKF